MRKFFLWGFFLIATISCSLPTGAATLIFSDGFETNLNNFSQSGTAGATFATTTSSKANGNASGSLDLTYGGASTYRAEAVITNGRGNFDFNQEYWLGFNFYYQNWANDSDGEIAPFQIHNRYLTWVTSCAFGAAQKNAPFMMVSSNSQLRFTSFGNIQRWSGALVPNTWSNIVLHFKISWTSAGYIEAWKDGVKLFRVDGVNTYQNDLCGDPLQTSYFKFGIYKPAWKFGATQSNRRTLLFDDIKIASGLDGYNMVYTSPGGSAPPPDTTAPVVSAISETAITANSATINFTTDEAADTRIEFGPTVAYGGVVTDAQLVTTHAASLTNLSANTLYHYRIVTKDLSGNITTGADRTFSTLATSTDPVISNIVVTPGVTTARFQWDTDIPSSTRVAWTPPGSASVSKYDATLVTAHDMTIGSDGVNPLLPSTQYNAKVTSKGAVGNLVEVTGNIFTTLAAIVNPVQSNIVVLPGKTTAKVTWTTDKATIGTVEYGVDTVYDSSVDDNNSSTSHTAILTGLVPNTLYHYRVSSTSTDTGQVTSSDLVFTTAGALVSDDFSTALNTQIWTVYHPLADSTVVTSGGVLNIPIVAGTVHDAWTTNNNAVRVTQQLLNNENFVVSAKFNSLPTTSTTAIGEVGLIFEESATTYAIFKVTGNGPNYFFGAVFAGASNSTKVNQPFTLTAPFYMRITRTGVTWSYEISQNGTAWTSVGASNIANIPTINSIGVWAGNLGSAPPAFTGVVDTFTVETPTPPPPPPPTDTTPPVVSNFKQFEDPVTRNSIFTWDTNEAATYLLQYGSSVSYGFSVADSALGTVHTAELTNLLPGTTYYYSLTATDAASNTSTPITGSFTTSTITPTNVPAIQNVHIVESCHSTVAQVAFETDVPTLPSIAYGLDTSYTNEVIGDTIGTEHILEVPNLVPGEVYNYQLRALIDGTTIEGIAPNKTFQFASIAPGVDTTGPILSAISQGTPTASSVTLTFSTNEPATSVVQYGVGDYTDLETGAETRNHSVTLTGLTANTTYIYRVTVSDTSGNTTKSSNLTFTTAP